MMSPYQGYTTTTTDVRVEGFRNGIWETLPVERYFPYGAGERTVRAKFATFALQDEERRTEKMQELSLKILALESDYSNVRLSIEQWSLSSQGYEAERTPEKTTVLFSITAVPE